MYRRVDTPADVGDRFSVLDRVVDEPAERDRDRLAVLDAQLAEATPGRVSDVDPSHLPAGATLGAA